MNTTIIGTCDVCGAKNAELSRAFVTGIETFACEECRDHDPYLRKPADDISPQASDALSFVTLALFVGAILMVTP